MVCPRCTVRVPPCECGVRVSSVSVSRLPSTYLCCLLFLSSRAWSILAAKSKSSPSQAQVKPKSGRIRKSHPAWPQSPYWSSATPPLRPQYPFLHTTKANLTPPASSFPWNQRPESWLNSHSLEVPFQQNSIPKVLTVLTWTLNPPTAASSSSSASPPCCYLLTGCPFNSISRPTSASSSSSPSRLFFALI